MIDGFMVANAITMASAIQSSCATQNILNWRSSDPPKPEVAPFCPHCGMPAQAPYAFNQQQMRPRLNGPTEYRPHPHIKVITREELEARNNG
jgi:hypothetical protein